MRALSSIFVIICVFSGCGGKPGTGSDNGAPGVVELAEDDAPIKPKGKKMTDYETDTIETSEGPLEITHLGHASLMMDFKGKVIHIDPFGKVGDYSLFPDADIILSTHHHFDHLDPDAVNQIRNDDTRLVYSKLCSTSITGGTVMNNGDSLEIDGIKIEAVPAYNIKHKRDNGEPFHPKGEGNGYVLTFGETRVYVAGDTENIPEMKELGEIDVAFLPMNLPYTMTPGMCADAAETIRPKILYPYHYGETDTDELVTLLKNHPDIEVRIRQLQ